MKIRIFVVLFAIVTMALFIKESKAQSWDNYRYTVQYNSLSNQGTQAQPLTYQYVSWVSYAIYSGSWQQNLNFYTDPSLASKVVQGFSDWGSYGALPDWIRTQQHTTYSADVTTNQLLVLNADVDPHGFPYLCGNSPGCVAYPWVLMSNQRAATYVYQYRVTFKPSLFQVGGKSITDANFQALLSHELGHVLGLGDLYWAGSCGSSSPDSLMMGAVTDNNQWQVCHGLLHPVAYDQSSIAAFWKQGEDLPATTVPAIIVNGDWLESRWTDRGWAEFGMKTQLQSTAPTNNCCQVLQNGVHYNNIGMHSSVQDRVIVDSPPYGGIGDGASFYLRGRGDGFYRVCAVPWNGNQNNNTEVIGTWHCTSLQYYDDPTQ